MTLPEVTGVNVDPDNVDDIDDALVSVSIETHGWRLQTAIANVASVVSPRSEPDRQGRVRATSVYGTKRTSHMLPVELAADRCSLLPGEVRPAILATMYLDDDGNRLGSDYEQVLYRGRRGLTYEDVARVLSADTRGDPDAEMLHRAAQLATILRANRGVEIPVYAQSADFDAILHWNYLIAEQLIEEAMVCTNCDVAAYAAENGINIPVRSHLESWENIDDPVVQKLEEMGLSDYEQHAFYGPNFLGHVGLGFPKSKPYTHYTSPIRRYPDLMAHQNLLAHLRRERPPNSPEWIMRQGAYCSWRNWVYEYDMREFQLRLAMPDSVERSPAPKPTFLNHPLREQKGNRVYPFRSDDELEWLASQGYCIDHRGINLKPLLPRHIGLCTVKPDVLLSRIADVAGWQRPMYDSSPHGDGLYEVQGSVHSYGSDAYRGTPKCVLRRYAAQDLLTQIRADGPGTFDDLVDESIHVATQRRRAVERVG